MGLLPASVELRTRRGDEAATHWQASLEADPNDVTALRALYAYYSARSDAKAAHYRQLLQAHATMPE